VSIRRLPVRPDLNQLHRQAKELLRDIHAGDANAIAESREYHPDSMDCADAKLADAQLVLARSYQASSWTRLVHAVQLADAIWRDDLDTVRTIITRNPALLREDVLIRRDSNWGPPMSYAANLGRDEIIRYLHRQGARDFEHAAGRAALQSHPDTLRLIYDLAGRPSLDNFSLAGPAYTLSVEGTAAMFGLGVRLGPEGVDTNTMEHLLGTDSRNPTAKHKILEMYVEHGFDPPDTPVMALHRGRIDLLEDHLSRDPDLFRRTFDVAEVFLLAPACAREPYEAQGTPVHATTLLHVAAYFDELEIAQWLLDRGMDVDARAAIDIEGFGGYTALFSTVVSQHNFWVNYGKGLPDEARFTRLLLDRGADPNIRASIRACLGAGHGGGPLREFRNVTPIGWGESYAVPPPGWPQRYPTSIFVSRESLRLIEERGGRR
jgi:Ankyrin repeat